ncbi:Oidioi.mRNA.OKI2018_I69.chr1.g3896.t1.cds [Oikopleura dioica]|uniref:Oidioi.mRNA.OKI2018_I69.chr1.g3896.t1.cds n=1 Tax=Oikopleura dioica TaxID=34765 RepID=A0ABN7SZH8_OIKDI|nr:Oidioi.mRNA.OKI2018_I69.chr1.g3896.t1.cds [Oikopleura dioica]
MQWWAYLLMLAVYIVYLLIGAAVFQKLEQPFEEKRCDDAKSKVREKKDEFGNEPNGSPISHSEINYAHRSLKTILTIISIVDGFVIQTQYFYIFGLNKKFCDGIDQWNKNETLSNNTSEVIKKLIMEWKSYDCSQEREDNAWKTIQNNKTQVQEYIKVWKAIAAPVLAKSFNDELLSIKGETVRKVMERTAQFGINNYLALKKDCTDHWNFHNAFFFAGTVATTIGYGNISPSTNHGKLFCITFTVIGIPYFAYMVGALAELISYKIDDIVKTRLFE